MENETEITQPSISSTNDFSIGAIVFERYRILEFVASGGNGRVYKAEDILLNITVALKVLLGDENVGSEIMRFQSEAKASSRLNHATIAMIYDFGLVDGTPYLSMEFVEGETLESLLKRIQRMSLPSFCRLFLQLAKALSHAHENGVIHRDLKPANVIVRSNSDGELVAKILDFGVAKLVDKQDVNLTPTGNIVGSPLYMSPEQARGERVTSQADLYSLGVMMFRALAGKVPLKSETAIETIMMVSRVPAPLLESAVEPQVLPPDLCDLVNNLLQKNPEDRPPLEAVVIPTLARLLDEVSVDLETDLFGPPDTATVSATTMKRPSLRSMLFFIVVVALGSVIVVSLLKLFATSQANLSPPVENHLMSEISDKVLFENLKPNKLKVLKYESNNGILDFTEQDLTDDQLSKIANPKAIFSIRANSSKVATLDSIPLFPNLTQLSVGKTGVTDNALHNLSGLKQLTFLDLQGDKITDASMPIIAKLKTLLYLDLSDTRVTPTGLTQLKSIPNLLELKLRNSNFTRSDIRIFASSLPSECKVVLAGSHNISEKVLQQLSQDFPDLRFDDLSSQVHLIDNEMKVTVFEKPRPLNELLTARHVYLNLKDRIENAYGKDTLRTRQQVLFLGNIEWLIGKPSSYKASKQYYDKALSMARKAHDGRLELEALDRLTTLGFCTEGFEKTKPLALRAIKLAQGKGPPTPASNKVMTFRYVQIAQQAKNAKLPLEAIPYYTKAIELSSESPDTASILSYRGVTYTEAKKYNQAIADHKKAVQIFKKIGAHDRQAIDAEISAYCYLAYCLGIKKDFQQALKFNSEFYRLAHRPGMNLKQVYESTLQKIRLMQELKYPATEIDPYLRELADVEKLLSMPSEVKQNAK